MLVKIFKINVFPRWAYNNYLPEVLNHLVVQWNITKLQAEEYSRWINCHFLSSPTQENVDLAKVPKMSSQTVWTVMLTPHSCWQTRKMYFQTASAELFARGSIENSFGWSTPAPPADSRDLFILSYLRYINCSLFVAGEIYYISIKIILEKKMRHVFIEFYKYILIYIYIYCIHLSAFKNSFGDSLWKGHI